MRYPDYLYYRDRNTAFTELAAEELDVHVVSANYFSVLGVSPDVGRFFLADEDVVPGRNPVVVLSHSFWQRRFDADPKTVGTTLELTGTPFTIVGVGPSGSHPRFRLAAWRFFYQAMSHQRRTKRSVCRSIGSRLGFSRRWPYQSSGAEPSMTAILNQASTLLSSIRSWRRGCRLIPIPSVRHCSSRDVTGHALGKIGRRAKSLEWRSTGAFVPAARHSCALDSQPHLARRDGARSGRPRSWSWSDIRSSLEPFADALPLRDYPKRSCHLRCGHRAGGRSRARGMRNPSLAGRKGRSDGGPTL
jgi:hypothetical protein